ncbi:MAG: 16S rRNA processing protein RimM [Chloroflexi bacterium]|nr:16S rRNA processing protein RimM [Chloroflexota bacterium]
MARRKKAGRGPRAYGRSLRWDDVQRSGGRVVIGRLRRPHGLKGEMILEVLTDIPQKRFLPGAVIYVGPRHIPLTIRSVRPLGEHLLLAFEGYPDRSAVEMFRNQWVTIPEEHVAPLHDEDEYYDFEVLGFQVQTEDGRPLGRLVEILETGANDVFIVEDETGRRVLLPVIQDVIRKFDFEKERILVRLLPGLLDEGEDT